MNLTKWCLPAFVLLAGTLGVVLLRQPDVREETSLEGKVSEGVVASHEEVHLDSARTDRSQPALPDPRDWSLEHELFLEEEIAVERGGSFERRRIVMSADMGKPVLLEELLNAEGEEQPRRLNRSMVADELLVSSGDPIDREELERLVEGTDWRLGEVSRNGLLATLKAESFDLETVGEGIELFSGAVRVAFDAEVEPNLIYYAMATRPDDELWDELWGLESQQDHDIDGPEGWDVLTDASSVRIAIVDTGVRESHEDLKGNLWRNEGEIAGNGLDDDGNGYVDDVFGINVIEKSGDPSDDYGHGTHVAGIVGAAGNNGLGTSGVAWRAQLMSVKFLNASGRGTLEDAVEAIDYALENGAKIINASWGGEGRASSLEQAMERARVRGVAIVAAAGNEGSNNDEYHSYPASSKLANVISVASSTRDGTLSGSSNYGFATTDLVAPGSGVLSTWHTADDAYSYESGTSMAAPYVTGVLALNMTLRPNDSLKLQLDRLVQSSRRKDDLFQRSRSGGVVNLARSLAMEEVPFPPVLIEHSKKTEAKLEGESVRFSATVSSELPVRFRWYFEGVELVGETGANLVLESIVESDAGRYQLVAENDDGMVDVEFVLRVLASDEELLLGLDADETFQVFTREGSPWTVEEDEASRGGSHIQVEYPEKYDAQRLSALVSGPGELRFLWRFANGNEYLSGATCRVEGESEQLYLRNGEGGVGRFTLEEAKEYEVVWEWVNSGDERATSGQLVIDYLKLYPIGEVPPIVYEHPRDQSVQPFSSTNVYALADGSNLTYAWYKDGEALPFWGESGVSIRDVGPEDEGLYHVVVSNTYGSDESRGGYLDVDEDRTPARFVERSADFAGELGERLDLSLEHLGSPPMSYQWYRDYYPIPGETGPMLSIESLRMEDSGAYSLEIDNPYGNRSFSDHAYVVVADKELAPSAVLGKRDINTYKVMEGEPFDILHYLEHVSDSMRFQWYLNGRPLVGETSLELKYEAIGYDQSGVYAIEVKNSEGAFRYDAYRVQVDLGVGSALDIEGYEWSANNIGDHGWRYGQSEVSMDGVDAVEFSREYRFREGSSYDDGGFSAAIVSRIEGPKNLSVYWKRTSESGFFEVDVDSYGGQYDRGEPIYVFSESDGEVGDWVRSVIHVPAGEHEVRWNFVGLDPEQKGWLDLMEETDAPAILGFAPATVLADSEGASIRIEAWGAGTLSYQWLRNGEPMEGETSETLAVAAENVNADNEYVLKVRSQFGETVSRTVQFVRIEDTHFAPEGVTVTFGGDGEWELSPWSDDRDITVSLADGESAWVDLMVEGPAMLTYARGGAQAFLDDVAHEEGEWTGLTAYYGKYLRVPEGEHKVTFRVANIGGNGRQRREVLHHVNLSDGAIFMETGDGHFPEGMIGGAGRRLFVYFAAELPAVASWYKDGVFLKSDKATTSSITYSGAFGYNAVEPSPDLVGDYYCEVTDANGVTARSKTMELKASDLLSFGEIVGGSSLSQPFNDQRFMQDFEVYYEGGSSARADFSEEMVRGYFQIFNSDSVDNRYPGCEMRVRLSGYDEATSVTIRDGWYRKVKLDLVEGWQKVSLAVNTANIHFEIQKSEGSRLRLWLDDFRSVDDLAIIKQPMHFASYLGGDVEFSVDAFSRGAVTYQWNHDGVPVAGATGSVLTIENLELIDLGTYEVVLKSRGGRVVSRPVSLSLAGDLGAAVEMPGVRVATWGDALWRVDKSVSIDGSSSLRSGDVARGGTSGIRFEFDSPGSFHFYQKVRYGNGDEIPWNSRYDTEGDFPPAFELVHTNSDDTGYGVLWLDRLSYSPLAAKTYRDWLGEQTEVFIQDASGFDELGDSDGDGVQNYLEFLFDLDPSREDSLPQLEFVHSEGRLNLGMNGRIVSNDKYTLVFELSRDLENWFPFSPKWQDVLEGNTLFREIGFGLAVPVDDGIFFRWSVKRYGDDGSDFEGK